MSFRSKGLFDSASYTCRHGGLLWDNAVLYYLFLVLSFVLAYTYNKEAALKQSKQ